MVNKHRHAVLRMVSGSSPWVVTTEQDSCYSERWNRFETEKEAVDYANRMNGNEAIKLGSPITIAEPLRTFATGAVRSTDGDDAAYYLISPIGLRRLAQRYAMGAKKYPPYNCERGIPISNLLNHAIRHVFLYLAGDRSDDHLAAFLWAACMACHSEESWPHLNGDLRPEIIDPSFTEVDDKKEGGK